MDAEGQKESSRLLGSNGNAEGRQEQANSNNEGSPGYEESDDEYNFDNEDQNNLRGEKKEYEEELKKQDFSSADEETINRIPWSEFFSAILLDCFITLLYIVFHCCIRGSLAFSPNWLAPFISWLVTAVLSIMVVIAWQLMAAFCEVMQQSGESIKIPLIVLLLFAAVCAVVLMFVMMYFVHPNLLTLNDCVSVGLMLWLVIVSGTVIWLLKAGYLFSSACQALIGRRYLKLKPGFQLYHLLRSLRPRSGRRIQSKVKGSPETTWEDGVGKVAKWITCCCPGRGEPTQEREHELIVSFIRLRTKPKHEYRGRALLPPSGVPPDRYVMIDIKALRKYTEGAEVRAIREPETSQNWAAFKDRLLDSDQGIPEDCIDDGKIKEFVDGVADDEKDRWLVILEPVDRLRELADQLLFRELFYLLFRIMLFLGPVMYTRDLVDAYFEKCGQADTIRIAGSEICSGQDDCQEICSLFPTFVERVQNTFDVSYAEFALPIAMVFVDLVMKAFLRLQQSHLDLENTYLCTLPLPRVQTERVAQLKTSLENMLNLTWLLQKVLVALWNLAAAEGSRCPVEDDFTEEDVQRVLGTCKDDVNQAFEDIYQKASASVPKHDTLMANLRIECSKQEITTPVCTTDRDFKLWMDYQFSCLFKDKHCLASTLVHTTEFEDWKKLMKKVIESESEVREGLQESWLLRLGAGFFLIPQGSRLTHAFVDLGESRVKIYDLTAKTGPEKNYQTEAPMMSDDDVKEAPQMEEMTGLAKRLEEVTVKVGADLAKEAMEAMVGGQRIAKDSTGSTFPKVCVGLRFAVSVPPQPRKKVSNKKFEFAGESNPDRCEFKIKVRVARTAGGKFRALVKHCCLSCFFPLACSVTFPMVAPVVRHMQGGQLFPTPFWWPLFWTTLSQIAVLSLFLRSFTYCTDKLGLCLTMFQRFDTSTLVPKKDSPFDLYISEDTDYNPRKWQEKWQKKQEYLDNWRECASYLRIFVCSIRLASQGILISAALMVVDLLILSFVQAWQGKGLLQVKHEKHLKLTREAAESGIEHAAEFGRKLRDRLSDAAQAATNLASSKAVQEASRRLSAGVRTGQALALYAASEQLREKLQPFKDSLQQALDQQLGTLAMAFDDAAADTYGRRLGLADKMLEQCKGSACKMGAAMLDGALHMDTSKITKTQVMTIAFLALMLTFSVPMISRIAQINGYLSRQAYLMSSTKVKHQTSQAQRERKSLESKPTNDSQENVPASSTNVKHQTRKARREKKSRESKPISGSQENVLASQDDAIRSSDVVAQTAQGGSQEVGSRSQEAAAIRSSDVVAQTAQGNAVPLRVVTDPGCQRYEKVLEATIKSVSKNTFPLTLFGFVINASVIATWIAVTFAPITNELGQMVPPLVVTACKQIEHSNFFKGTEHLLTTAEKSFAGKGKAAQTSLDKMLKQTGVDDIAGIKLKGGSVSINMSAFFDAAVCKPLVKWFEDKENKLLNNMMKNKFKQTENLEHMGKEEFKHLNVSERRGKNAALCSYTCHRSCREKDRVPRRSGVHDQEQQFRRLSCHEQNASCSKSCRDECRKRCQDSTSGNERRLAESFPLSEVVSQWWSVTPGDPEAKLLLVKLAMQDFQRDAQRLLYAAPLAVHAAFADHGPVAALDLAISHYKGYQDPMLQSLEL